MAVYFSSRDSSLVGSAPNLLDVITELENQAKTGSTSSAAQLANLQQVYNNRTSSSIKSTTEFSRSTACKFNFIRIVALRITAPNSTHSLLINGLLLSIPVLPRCDLTLINNTSVEKLCLFSIFIRIGKASHCHCLTLPTSYHTSHSPDVSH